LTISEISNSIIYEAILNSFYLHRDGQLGALVPFSILPRSRNCQVGPLDHLPCSLWQK